MLGALKAGAKLDLLAQDTSKALTNGFGRSGSSPEVFTYSEAQGVAPTLRNGELFVDLGARADVWVSDWKSLQKAINGAKNGQVIGLSQNIPAKGEDRILVNGKEITLELNGHSLDRGRTSPDSDGHAIEVRGASTLTIRDSRGTGVIRGGAATRGGGINIQAGSTCILEGGSIRENGAEWSGGVYVHGTFRMTGGAVTGNASREGGGGICKSCSGNVKLTNARITNNVASGKDYVKVTGTDIDMGAIKINFNHADPKSIYYGGAGFYNEKGGSATLKNCVISGNRGESSGGGVYNDKKCALTLDGCTVEKNTAVGSGAGVCNRGRLTVVGGSYTGNSAGDFGGGICVSDDGNASISISGALVMRDNKDGKGNDVYLASGKKLNIAGRLKDVRGQVLLRINHDRDPNSVATLGGISSWSLGGRYQSAAVGGGFEESPSEKIGHVNEFYRQYGGVALPRDVATHLDLFYYVPTNIVEKQKVSGMGMVPIRIPTESAREVNAALFGDGGLCDEAGYFLGWVNMIDAGTPDVAARIWKTNFYDMDYVTLTVDAGVSAADLESGLYTENEVSGLGEIEIAAAPGDGDEVTGGEDETGEQKPGVHTFRLYKGTEITLPQCLYTYDQAKTGRAFQS